MSLACNMFLFHTITENDKSLIIQVINFKNIMRACKLEFNLNVYGINMNKSMFHYANIKKIKLNGTIIYTLLDTGVFHISSFDFQINTSIKNLDDFHLYRGINGLIETCIYKTIDGNYHRFTISQLTSLGRNSVESISMPIKINKNINVKKIAFGSAFRISLYENQMIDISGHNTNGALCEIPANGKFLSCILIPKFISIEIIDVCCGNDHTIFLDQNRHVLGMGSNLKYQLGMKETKEIVKLKYIYSGEVMQFWVQDNYTILSTFNGQLLITGTIYNGEIEKKYSKFTQIKIDVNYINGIKVEKIVLSKHFKFLNEKLQKIIFQFVLCMKELKSSKIIFIPNVLIRLICYCIIEGPSRFIAHYRSSQARR